MNKTFKKRERALVAALTRACETAKAWDSGFLWLTHTVRHNNFPDSLVITCIFSLDAELIAVKEQGIDKQLCVLIQKKMNESGLAVENVQRYLRVDSEESCLREDAGNWQKRLDKQRL